MTTDSCITIGVRRAHVTAICLPAIVAPVVMVAIAPRPLERPLARAHRKAYGLPAGRHLFVNLKFVNYCHDLA
jgi:hypothetical protein